MSRSTEITVVPSLSTGVLQQNEESVLAFDFDFRGLASAEEEGPAVLEAAVVTGVVNPGPAKQFMTLNKKHTVRATYTVKVNSNDELIPASSMVSTMDLPGVFKSGKAHSISTPTVKRKTTQTFQDSITVTDVVPKEAGEFTLSCTAEYHGTQVEKSATIVVR